MAKEIEFDLTGFKVRDLRDLERIGRGELPINTMVETLGRWAVGGEEILDELDVDQLPVVAQQLSEAITAKVNPPDATGKN